MAVPKSRRKRRVGLKVELMEGLENSPNHSHNQVVDINFEEAEFLDYGVGHWDTGGREVVMRDV